MSREGSLEAPTRHVLDWRSEDFYDEAKLDAEMRRVFDICHGCRRCFNLCDSFPRLFDLIDNGPTGELDGVPKEKYGEVEQACTLCDMCFMTKCPYVPPHEFDLDFPHLMLRYRAVEARKGKVPLAERELTKTDRNGRLAGMVAPLANWATETGNKLTRPAMEALTGIDRNASRYGLCVGNVRAARVQRNEVQGDPKQTVELSLHGIRIAGVFGPQVLVRDNRLVGTTMGIRLQPTTYTGRLALWVLEGNMGEQLSGQASSDTHGGNLIVIDEKWLKLATLRDNLELP